MKDKNGLISAVMLETMWETKRNDMIDLISPMVKYCIAQKTSIGAIVNIKEIQEDVKAYFSYENFPESIIIKIMARDSKHFSKKNRQYQLISSLDKECSKMDNQRKECNALIESIGSSLFNYLKSHCKKIKIKSESQTFDFFQSYLRKFGISVEMNNLEYMNLRVNDDEVNYYISNYIYDVKEKDKEKYNDIISIIKGFFLKTAIYMQPENGDLISATYKNVNIFYDTPFLLSLLHYQSDNEHDSAISLHNSLKELGASFYYFPQTEEEIYNILNAYKHSLIGGNCTGRTLEGLDMQNYNYSGVERLQSTFTNTLKNSYKIILHERPSHKTNTDNSVDIDSVNISESDLFTQIKNKVPNYPESSLNVDISSAMSIHYLRGGYKSKQIEKCKYIFITTNVAFTDNFNKYYSRLFGNDFVMPVITAVDLSAFTWVKCSKTDSSIPEKNLLANAYMTMQLPSNIIEKFNSILSQLEREGEISHEELVVLASNRIIQKEYWKSNFPNPDDIQKESVYEIKARYDESILLKNKKEIQNAMNISQQKRIDQAKKYAKSKRNKLEKILKIMIRIMAFVIGILLCLGVIYSYITSLKTSVFVFKLSIITIIIYSIISVVEWIFYKSKHINAFIDKQCNAYEMKIYDNKKSEYDELKY